MDFVTKVCTHCILNTILLPASFVLLMPTNMRSYSVFFFKSWGSIIVKAYSVNINLADSMINV